ncbi:hypothetical protein KM043_001617 [Ampulex compressa]|nr:hypothetical protein KM043_001617 [Ampulex compressa]
MPPPRGGIKRFLAVTMRQGKRDALTGFGLSRSFVVFKENTARPARSLGKLGGEHNVPRLGSDNGEIPPPSPYLHTSRKTRSSARTHLGGTFAEGEYKFTDGQAVFALRIDQIVARGGNVSILDLDPLANDACRGTKGRGIAVHAFRVYEKITKDDGFVNFLPRKPRLGVALLADSKSAQPRRARDRAIWNSSSTPVRRGKRRDERSNRTVEVEVAARKETERQQGTGVEVGPPTVNEATVSSPSVSAIVANEPIRSRGLIALEQTRTSRPVLPAVLLELDIQRRRHLRKRSARSADAGGSRIAEAQCLEERLLRPEVRARSPREARPSPWLLGGYAPATSSRPRVSDMLPEDPNDGKISTIIGVNRASEEPADYERAISKTGYGSFNLLILLAALPIAWAGLFDLTTGAFILASAECDLRLTFFRKGLLVAFPYIAMTATAFSWDYLAPYVGARSLFVLALLADCFLNVLGSATGSYHVFLLLKFLSGVLAGGPLAMVMPYLAEFHSAKYKARFSTWVGLVVAVGNIVPAALAFIVLPLDWKVEIFGREYNSWRIYLLICSIPQILGLVTAGALPQSPKYLTQAGLPERALGLLQRMYSMNTGKPADTFPIKALVAQRDDRATLPLPKASMEKMRQSWYNARLLLSTPYLPAFGFVCVLQFGSMLGFNTMRLWVPHLFIVLNNFDADHWRTKWRAATMCEMLDRRASIPARPYLNCSNFEDACFEWTVRPVIYQNSTIIACSAVVFSFLISMATTTRFRKKFTMLAAFLISVVSSFGINWAQSAPYMLTLAAAIIVTTRIAGNIVTAVNVDVIPIPLRATGIGIVTAVGNLGAVVGNLVFSALLGPACIVAYTGLGLLFLGCFCLCFFYPRPVKPSPDSLVRLNVPK